MAARQHTGSGAVNAAKVTTGVASSTSDNFAAAVVAGNAIVVCITMWSTGGGANIDVSTVTDTRGSTYTQVATRLQNENRVSIWRAYNITGGTNAVTVNTNEAGDITFGAVELDAVLTTDPNDANNTATGTSTAPSVSVTTVDSAPQMVGAIEFSGSDRTLTQGSGYALLREHEGGSSNMPLHMEYQLFASSGAKTVNGTIGTGSVTWQIAGASFKSSAGGPAASLFPRALVVGQAVHRANTY